MNAEQRRLNEITEKVIGCSFKVGTGLGCGFVEKVYENALAHELRKAGLKTQRQKRIVIRYDGVVVGDYSADLLVEESVLVELKAVKAFDDTHLAQCLNYLKAIRLKICLLINFGLPAVKVKRIVNEF